MLKLTLFCQIKTPLQTPSIFEKSGHIQVKGGKIELFLSGYANYGKKTLIRLERITDWADSVVPLCLIFQEP